MIPCRCKIFKIVSLNLVYCLNMDKNEKKLKCYGAAIGHKGQYFVAFKSPVLNVFRNYTPTFAVLWLSPLATIFNLSFSLKLKPITGLHNTTSSYLGELIACTVSVLESPPESPAISEIRINLDKILTS